MIRRSIAIFATCLGLSLSISAAKAGAVPQSSTKLSAAEIADKNVAARGGLQAWRAVHYLMMTGKMGVGGNQRATLPLPVPDRKGNQPMVPQRPKEEVQLPFIMDLGRPRKMRLELQFDGQTAIQVYDGTNGWKLRPYLNRRDVEPFTAEELKAASMQPDIDGPLIDYAVKGTKVELDGVEKVGDNDTYKLKLTTKDGRVTYVWIDAQTFLEAKMDGLPRRLDGVDHPVEIYLRDFRPVSGLQIPYVLETKVLPVAQNTKVRTPAVPIERIVLDRVVVNPNLEEAIFSKPNVAIASNAK